MAEARAAIVLVAMPWAAGPSIQLGVVHALLARAGLPVASRSLHVAAMQFFVEESRRGAAPRVKWSDYNRVAQRHFDVGLGDWIFAVPPFHDTAATDEAYLALLRAGGVDEEMLAKARWMKGAAPRFLDDCAAAILAAAPRVVGFTTTFSQNVASLALAKLLKARDPEVRVVFGGANCDGPMGAALSRAFPFIDVVVRGEAERVLPPLVRDLLDGRPVARLVSADGPVAMDEVPAPDYDEFFARVDAVPGLGAAYRPYVRVPFESARGCWWGEKSQCTFCGLNGTTMKFRSKSPARVTAELTALAARHRVLDFQAVDNIIDLGYMTSVLPELRATGFDFGIFYETKANLKLRDLVALRDGGVGVIQPGIESLSTPILRLMKKGVAALHNVRLLKWAAELGVRVMWNLIYGFPGEPVEEYARMAELCRALTHLEAPNLNRLHLDRFSPYHQRPAEHGIAVGPPLAHYRHLYPTDEATVAELAYAFELRYLDGREPERYVAPLREVVRAWQQNWHQHAARSNALGQGSLRWRRGPAFLTIADRRMNLGARDHTLGALEGAAYLATDDGASVDTVLRRLHREGHGHVAAARLEALFADLVGARVMFEEHGRYLSLALPATPRAIVGAAAREPEVGEPRPEPPRRVLPLHGMTTPR